jgi:hypothetical protein
MRPALGKIHNLRHARECVVGKIDVYCQKDVSLWIVDSLRDQTGTTKRQYCSIAGMSVIKMKNYQSHYAIPVSAGMS